jgi:hypothetical protein
MTVQFKKDLRTIIEVAAYILISVVVSTNKWVLISFIVLCASVKIYYSYFKKYDDKTVLFPTLNDESSKMAAISYGFVLILFSVIGYYVFSLTIYFLIAGSVLGILVFLFGFFASPKGWISVEKNSLKIYGLSEKIDTRQLKEITLKNDKITFTNIYGEDNNSFNLKLNSLTAEKIKSFLTERLSNDEILINDLVVDEA